MLSLENEKFPSTALEGGHHVVPSVCILYILINRSNNVYKFIGPVGQLKVKKIKC